MSNESDHPKEPISEEQRKAYRSSEKPDDAPASTPKPEEPGRKQAHNPDVAKIQRDFEALQEYVRRMEFNKPAPERPTFELEPEPEPEHVKLFTGQRIFNAAAVIAIICAFIYANDPQPQQNRQIIDEIQTKAVTTEKVEARLDAHEERLNFLFDELGKTNRVVTAVRSHIESLDSTVENLFDRVSDLEFNRASLIKLANKVQSGANRFVMWIRPANQVRQPGDLIAPSRQPLR